MFPASETEEWRSDLSDERREEIVQAARNTSIAPERPQKALATPPVMPITGKGPLVIGIGNPWRGDDGIGHAVVDALEGTAGLATAKSHGEPAELMELWQGHDPVILVDAIVTGAAPGTLHRLDAREPLPRGARYSSHGIGLAEAVELARSLGDLPGTLIVHGIEPARLENGAGLSPEISAAIFQMSRNILKEFTRPRPDASR
nr:MULTISPECIES: hydrogenase maturation protease [unclassified Thioalkalivibrio]